MINPYYQSDSVTLYFGDCQTILPELNVKFDACIVDPPYGCSACKWDTPIPLDFMWKHLNNLVKTTGAIVIFGTEPFSSVLRCSNLKMFKYDWIWQKERGFGFLDSKFRPLKSHEIISVFSKGGCSNGSKPAMVYNPQGLIPVSKNHKYAGNSTLLRYNSKPKTVRPQYTNYPKSVLTFGKATCKLHPTEKPVKLLEYLIKTHTNEGDLILDFCAGSGSTGVAAQNTKRKAILIENEEKYCEITAKRLADMMEK